MPAKLMTVLVALLLSLSAVASEGRNRFDEPVLHPAIPLVDESGANVLDSGQPYSSRMSCGNSAGGGCHDYDRIVKAYHFQQGRDETHDSFGAHRGVPQLVGPGFFGGFTCMQGSNPVALAKQSNASPDAFGDLGSAGLIKTCGGCHAGGGWSETDRTGARYDAKADPVDEGAGDYFDRDGDRLVRWDWQASGVREADCLICHVDLKQLKVFPDSGLDTNADPVHAWGTLQERQLLQQGFFREANSAIFEFLNVAPDTANGAHLLTVERTVDGSDDSLTLNDRGKPRFRWNRAAFDGNGKAQFKMLRFPASDNCMLCHLAGAGTSRVEPDIKGSRRGFSGFGSDAEPADTNGTPITSPSSDIHKGVTWTEANGETRVLDNCSGCHTKQYYKRSFANIDLDADHDFPKGNGDADVRNDLDNDPAPLTCEYCHRDAKNPALPSGQSTLLDAHRERWRIAGYMVGIASGSQNRTVQVHFDDLTCQACHNHGVSYGDQPLPLHYRKRVDTDGQLRTIPYVPSLRYVTRDKTSGHVLYRHERNAVLRSDPSSNRGSIVDPSNNALLGSVPRLGDEFGMPSTYSDFKALKTAYDSLLKAKGYANPDVRFVFTETSDYIVTHQTRRAADAVPCADCHTVRSNGSVNGAVAARGILGSAKEIELTRLPDPRLVQEGVVELGMPYFQAQSDGRITETVANVIDASAIAPNLSVLQSETARAIGGPFKVVTADVAQSIANLTNDTGARLRSESPADAWLTFVTHLGDRSVRAVSVLVPGTTLNRILLDGLRVEVTARDPSALETRRLKTLAAARSVYPLYRVEILGANGQPSTDFGATDGFVKLPYLGPATRQRQVRPLYSLDGKRWRRLPAKQFVAFQANSSARPGYVLVKLAKPVHMLAVADTVRSAR